MSRSPFTSRTSQSSPSRRSSPMLFVLVALVALVASVAAGCGARGTGDKGYVAGDGVITEIAPADRTQVGSLTGTLVDGGHFDLAAERGKVVVMNVWGSWCAPCRAEAHVLAAAARQLGAGDGSGPGDAATNGTPVVFVGINTRDASRDNARAFERTYDVGYPSIYDPSGDTLLAFQGTIGPNAIPSTLVIDARGRVAATVLGGLTSATTLVDLVHDAAQGVVKHAGGGAA
ncbi:MAG: TlpA disulfide reductase family protein [Marmoricola sp.]